MTREGPPYTAATVPDRLRALRFPASTRGRVLLGIAIVAVLAVPLLVALVALGGHEWFPLLDMAQTEMRVRDVASGHPPLTGLAGRIGTFGQQGSHPGPLSFWALWPFYQLFGAGSWGLEAAAVVLNILAMALALWLAYRRGGAPLLLAMGAVLAVLTRAYGATLLTQPWNPYLPMMWWFAFLLAVWSVLCDDLPALPVLVFTGSYCMQTHVSYLGLIGGMAVVALGYTAWRARRLWSDRRARDGFVRWGAVAIALGAFLWLPPVIDQLTESGNLRVLWDYFTNPPEEAIGPGEGLKVLLVSLSPWRLVVTGATTESGTSGSVVPGVLLVGAWLGAAVVVWRRRAQSEVRPLARLHVALAFGLGFALVSATRIFGFVWYYLTLWAFGLAALMLLAIGWTAVVEAGRRWGDASARFTRAGAGVLTAVMLVAVTVFSIEASSTEVPTPRLNDTLGAVVEPTARAVDALPERDAPYLITWLPDPIGIGAQGYGLLNELDRRGLDVRAEDVHINGATPHRIIKKTEAKVEIHIAVGPDEIERWRDEPGFDEVSFFEPRTRRERDAFERLRTRVIEDLIAAGLSERVPLVQGNMFVLTFDTRVPEETRRRISRMIDLGLPAAVFIGPPTVTS